MGENRRGIKELLEVYPPQPRFLLPILQDIQSSEKFLSTDSMKAVAEYLDVPDSRVFAVATFYKSLSLVPKGEREVKVCMGTACHLRGAGEVLSAFTKKLGIANGETTPDGRFSIETVNCLGACALAPVAMIGDEVRGGLTPSLIDEIIGEGS